MAHRVCPWWMGYLLASPLRRIRHSPSAILSPYIHAGMTVLEPGPGMGFFTLPLARDVGPSGRVVAVDIQPRMLAALRKRAVKAGLSDRMDLRLTGAGTLGVSDLAGAVDFALLFYMAHEIQSPDWFFREVAQCLKPDGRALLVEPPGHVTEAEFQSELSSAARGGLSVAARPAIGRNVSAVLMKT
jgi:ubiquinone/menaquinone biosynthesis C-methylase UbiE